MAHLNGDSCAVRLGGERSIRQRVFETCLTDMIGDIQGFRMQTIDESKLLGRVAPSLENLRILSKDGPIKAAVEHLELSILNALESDPRSRDSPTRTAQFFS